MTSLALQNVASYFTMLLLCCCMAIAISSSLAAAQPSDGSDYWDIATAAPKTNIPQNDTGYKYVLPFDENRHVDHYKVAVLSNRGPETAMIEYNATFVHYLAATAGRRFDRPITFSMHPMSFDTILDEHEGMDFVFANPSIFSCIETEFGAQALVTQVARRVVNGQANDLTQLGGVMVALANNTRVNTIADYKDSVVALTGLTGLGSAQAQFAEIQKAGLSYINDPKQLVFTSDLITNVLGVMKGDFDIAFIRTDQLERSNTGEMEQPLEEFLPQFKIINSQDPRPRSEGGGLFPFETSTPLYPEWGVGALDHVDRDITRAVHEALTAIDEHAKVGKAYQECIDSHNVTFCEALPFPNAFVTQARKDTTREMALLAHQATTIGRYTGWRTSLSNSGVRDIQHATGYLQLDEESHKWQCVRSVELYDALTCPKGFFRKPKQDVDEGCEKAGLECKEPFQCMCKPCQRGYNVDVFPLNSMDSSITKPLSAGLSSSSSLSSNALGCEKMSLCGSTEQLRPLSFRAKDNLERENLTVEVILYEGEESRNFSATYSNSAFSVVGESGFTYDFTVTTSYVGVLIMEIFADGVQIPESPLRMVVEDRSCELEFGYEYEPTKSGHCVCKDPYVDIGGKCVSLSVLLPAIIVPLMLLLVAAFYWYADYKRKEADALWTISEKDLNFPDVRTVLGQGTFGEVLLAEYHGTSVAVKQVLPPPANVSGSRKNAASRDSVDGRRSMVGRISIAGRGSTAGRSSMLGLKSVLNDEDKKESYSKEQERLVSGTKHHLLSGLLGSRNARSTFTSSSKQAKLRSDFIKEMRLLSKLRHPCIAAFVGAVIEGRPKLVLEYCEHGSLYDILSNDTMHIEGELLLPILRDIAQGMRFLHSTSPPIVHGDIKSQNILITSAFRAKVADFGLSQKGKTTKARGSPFWMAPELLRGESNSPASDQYAVGVVLYELYARKMPYEGESARNVLKLVADPEVNKRPSVPQGCPVEIATLMKACWNADPTKRPTAIEMDEQLKLFQVENVQPGSMPMSNLSFKSHAARTASNQDFLSKVFPKHIANALTRGEKVAPEHHDCVTIFFSDIVGFTNISSSCSPIKVSDMLDRLYMTLDSLSTKHGLFKVETIGDAYMAVSNLIDDQETDHVKRVAEFALEAVHEASKISIDLDDPSKGHVQIRVGFHSGSVVSNVIGSLNPRYGLFGDTVNTASRMESNSKPGMVNCSSESAALLREQAPHLELINRGEIEVKGKGKMTTYFVHGGAGIFNNSEAECEAAGRSGSQREVRIEQAPESRPDRPKVPVVEFPSDYFEDEMWV